MAILYYPELGPVERNVWKFANDLTLKLSVDMYESVVSLIEHTDNNALIQWNATLNLDF